MDLSEAITAISELSARAEGAKDKVQFLSVPGDPRAYAAVKPDGTHELCYPPHPPRDHTFRSVDQIIPFVQDATTRLPCSPSVWYSDKGIVILLEDHALELDARPKATVPLSPSPEFVALLRECKSPQERLPKQFIHWVREYLIDSIPHVEDFLKLLRSIKVNTSESGHVRTGQGRESIGREVDAEVSSEIGQIPEQLVCEIRVFDDPSIKRRVPVRCILDVNPRTCELTCTPLATDLKEAADTELANIAELLSTLDCPVYFGSP
jgi:hypothetical protein